MGRRFFTRAEGALKATPLFLVLLVIEFTGAPYTDPVVYALLPATQFEWVFHGDAYG